MVTVVKTFFGQAGTFIFDAVRLNAQTKNLPTLRRLLKLTTLLKWVLAIWTLAMHNLLTLKCLLKLTTLLKWVLVIWTLAMHNLLTLKCLLKLTTLLKWVLVIWTLAMHNRYLYLKGCTLKIQTNKMYFQVPSLFLRDKMNMPHYALFVKNGVD